MRICGWCRYAGSGYMVNNCLVKGKCGLIPLPMKDTDLVPPVQLKEDDPKKALERYEEFDRMDNMAVQGFKRIRAIVDKIIEKMTACGKDDIPLDGQVFWNTECILVKGMNNEDIRNEIILRLDGWSDFFEKRIDERRHHILKLKDIDNPMDVA